jgi:hypothetical protein
MQVQNLFAVECGDRESPNRVQVFQRSVLLRRAKLACFEEGRKEHGLLLPVLSDLPLHTYRLDSGNQELRPSLLSTDRNADENKQEAAGTPV